MIDQLRAKLDDGLHQSEFTTGPPIRHGRHFGVQLLSLRLEFVESFGHFCLHNRLLFHGNFKPSFCLGEFLFQFGRALGRSRLGREADTNVFHFYSLWTQDDPVLTVTRT